MRRSIRAGLCALLLLLALTPAPVGAAWDDGLTFLAVNVRMLSLSEFMPITVNNSVYVPVTVFDAATNGGVSLGVYGAMNKTLNCYTMYSSSRNLIFDLSTGTSSDYPLDAGGEAKDPKCLVRNGKIYVSAYLVCKYFDLDYSYVATTPYKYPLVRIRTKDSPYPSAEAFTSAANSAMLNILNDYYAVVSAKPPAAVTPVPSPSPTSTPVPGLDDRSGTAFQLALRFDTGQAGQAVLDTLEGEGRTALLLFPADGLEGQDDLIRRALGEGHTIGLLVPGDSAEAARAAIEEGNRLLGHIGRVRTRIVLADGATAATLQALKGDGWLCWTGGIDGVPNGRTSYSTSTEVLRQAGAKTGVARVTMDDSSAGAASLRTVLRTVRQEKYNYRLVVETELG